MLKSEKTDHFAENMRANIIYCVINTKSYNKIISVHADGCPFPAPVSTESPKKSKDQSFAEEVSLKKDH